MVGDRLQQIQQHTTTLACQKRREPKSSAGSSETRLFEVQVHQARVSTWCSRAVLDILLELIHGSVKPEEKQ